ncbi:MAG: trimeric intracellular cation channel family protein [Lachnospiraceae bacterium]|nr:trimeric intracellular cation channel family protein [Lachnospiraceae bacterium]
MWSFALFLGILNTIGIIAFSISGAMVAIDEELDLFGVIFLGIITSMGGGVTRDLLLGLLPPHMFDSYTSLAMSMITSLLVFIIAYITRDYYKKHSAFIDSLNNIFDAAGLGVFTIAGMQITAETGYGYNTFLLIFLGVTTGVGGGLIRDIIVSRKPMIFAKHIYAVASIIGACIYLLCLRGGISATLSSLLGIAAIFTIRMLATVFKWNLPRIRFTA